MQTEALPGQEDDSTEQKQCPRCGNTNPRLARHCMQCGSALL